MIRLHILDRRARLLQPPADWFPLWINRHLLLEQGIQYTFHTTITPQLFDCDVLGIASRHFHLEAQDSPQREATLKLLASWRHRVKALIWFDCRDSTGNTQFEVLPYVSAYWKRQLLKDRDLYTQSWYGNRVYTDYIHRNFNITDSYYEEIQPLPSQYRDKLDISWSPGLLDFRGGTLPRLLAQTAMNWLEAWSRTPHWIAWQDPARVRPTTMLATFNPHYTRNTVAWQRRSVQTILPMLREGTVIFDRRRSLRQTIAMRRQSQIILSLFGWGELCSRDFQTFIAGAALIMPDVSHVDTWPMLHKARQTYWPLKWDLSDLPDAYDYLRTHSDVRQAIARGGQRHYQKTWSQAGREAFCTRLASQLHKLLRS